MAEAQAAEAEAVEGLRRTQTSDATGTSSPVQLLARETQAKVAAARATAAEANLRIAKAEQALAEAQRSEIDLKVARTELKPPTPEIISHPAAPLPPSPRMRAKPPSP